MKKYIFFLMLFFLAHFAIAQLDTIRLNQYFYTLESQNKVMTSVCLYKEGKIIYDNAIGYNDIENNSKANVYTQYRIGSISKIFTAVMILQMIEEKKLSFETKLNKFFPNIKNSDKITIEQLLQHRSGIENYTNESDYTNYFDQYTTEDEMLKKIEKLPSDFAPGSQFSYSNSNYLLLAFIIEKINKQSYSLQLTKRICAKANLADTKSGGPIHADNNEAKSYNYVKTNWKLQKETDLSVSIGAGNIVSTAKDLCLFIEAIFDGKLISLKMLDKMKTMKDNYGMGLLEFPFYEKKFYGHTGGIDGFQSMLGYNEKDKLAFCILGNGLNYPINDIAIALLSAAYGKSYSIPISAKTPASKNESDKMKGEYKSEKLGMTISIFEKEGQLMAQATNQSAFPLEKINDLEYQFEQAGIKITFQQNETGQYIGLQLLQGGMDLFFEKK